MNPDEGPNVIFQNGFQPGWSEQGSWPYPATHTETVASPSGVNGDTALKVTYSAAWGGIELHNNAIDTRQNRALIFRVRSDENTRSLRVAVNMLTGVSQWLSLTDDHYIPSLPGYPPMNVGQWYSVVIPLADFAMAPEDVYVEGFMFQSSVAGTMYLDDVMVVENFKLPLPGGKSWLLTTEIGDQGCNANEPPLASHTIHNYFSLDFDDKSQEGGQESGVPMYAVAGGKVLYAGFAEGTPQVCNGYYAVIDHDYDGNLDTGIQSRYLHMVAGSLTVQTGDTVSAGTKLGIVGGTGSGETNPATGESCGTWGTHSHIGFRSIDKGDSNVTELDHIILEGKRLSQYTAICDGNGYPTRYFPSSNTQ